MATLKATRLKDTVRNFSGAYGDLSGTPTLGTAAAEDVSAFAAALGADDNYVTDAEKTALHAAGGDVALGALGTKNPPIDADKAIYRDSTASDGLVTSTWTQVKAFLKTYFDTLYQAVGSYLTSANISDTAYASSWNGITTIAPSKNAVYDEMETKSGTGHTHSYLPLAGGILTGGIALPALRYDQADSLNLDATHFAVFADATTYLIDIVVPDPTGCAGRIYIIKVINIDNGVQISGYDIDGAPYTFALVNDSIIIQSSGVAL